MTDALGDLVTAGGGEVTVDHDMRLGLELVADPADTDARHFLDAGLLGGPLHGLGQRRIDGIHEPREDLAGGILENPQDRDGYEQPDDRVRLREAEPDARGADDHRQ